MSQPETELSSPASDAGEGLSIDQAFERLSAQPEEPEQGHPEGDDIPDEPAHEDEPEDAGEQHEEVEEEPAAEEAEAEPDEPVYQVKVQGKVLNVKQSELIAGYSREADYRQKTASHAQEKAQFHEAATTKAQELSQTANRLQTMAHLMAQDLVGDKAELSQLLNADPVAYIQAKAKYDEKQARVFEAFRAADEFNQSQAQAANQPPPPEFVAEKQEELLNLIPEWRDHNKQSHEQALVASLLQSHGYSVDELKNLFDPRAIVVARKAALYDQLQQAKAKKAPTPVPTAKPVKATAQSGDAQSNVAAKQAFQKLKRTGSLDDALAALNARDRK